MLYNLTELLQRWLDEAGLYPLVMVMFQLEFRAFCAALLSFALVLAFARRVIGWLRRQKIGDTPEFHHAELNQLMSSRAGTPTMGGILICGSILVTVLLLGDVLHSRYIQLSIIILLWLVAVGSVDDWLKLTASRRAPGSRDGLLPWEKLLFQVGIGLIAGFFLYHADASPDAHVLNLPLQRTYPPTPALDSIVQPPSITPTVIIFGVFAFTVLTCFFITATSNAMNITDGMDGLACGTLLVAAIVFMVFTWISGSPRAAYFLLVPHVPGAGELMVVTGAMAGACLGFLWFNASPASVFMGDTGALPLGGLLAFVAVAIRQEVLLVLVGGVFFAELGSVALQTGWYKWTRMRTGTPRRIFRCAPLHHHFHLGGWSEVQVVTRAWIVAIVLAMAALVSLKLR
ncbi:MAG: phospho-N-acetylmuramoyl-pentapeptide-transferase [Phycisphaerales bacterium]|nr:phospho-N-acetylmuramoyl-pentapeptide-transferase [Phycisphaerales bacterium]